MDNQLSEEMNRQISEVMNIQSADYLHDYNLKKCRDTYILFH